MSSIPVALSGVVYDLYNRTSQRVVIFADLSYADRGVGGGPIVPGAPPVIWGPDDPRLGYGLPGQPPGFWGPNDPRPTPPIVIPRPPIEIPPMPEPPPPDGTVIKEPPTAGGWGYFAGWGWAYFPMGSGPQPKT